MTPPSSRIAVLDNARALLSLLGIPFHTVLFFCLSLQPSLLTTQPTLLQLTHQLSAVATHALSALFFIQSFQMPCFFLLAGFVARLLCQTKGLTAFIHNRLIKIAIPFLFCWLWKIPLYYLLCLVVYLFFRHNLGLQQQLVHSDDVWNSLNNLKDLWFLYVLLWIDVLTVVMVWASSHSHWLQKHRWATHPVVLKGFSKPYFYGVLAALFSAVLWSVPHLGYRPLEVCLRPSISLLVFYGLWYGIGWCLHEHHTQISQWFKANLLKLALAPLLYVMYLANYFHGPAPPAWLLYGIQLFIYQLSLCYMVFSLLAIAWRYLQATNRTLSYLSGASYWLYLVQVPIITLLIGTFRPSGHAFYLQNLMIIIATFTLSLGSYQILVRHTWLNRLVGQNHATSPK